MRGLIRILFYFFSSVQIHGCFFMLYHNYVWADLVRGKVILEEGSAPIYGNIGTFLFFKI